MEWKRLHAVFGALDHDTLELHSGFNLIYAPNESGKSTWCAFLRAMLYGLPTRTRGQDAEKSRYAPWSGRAMEGHAELSTGGETLVLSRTTARPGSPMGHFSARYAGTAAAAPLSAADCGETLTGVPREVFERSAFITQTGMVIDRHAELERRIAALISSGEENCTCAEATARLKKQQHRLRYHKTGLLPALEEEQEGLAGRLTRSRELRRAIDAAQRELNELERQEEALLAAIADAAAAAETETHREYAQLQHQADQADALVLRLQEEANALPSAAELATLKSAAAGILLSRRTLENAHAQTALRAREAAESRRPLDAFPLFSGLTADQAEAEAAADRALYQTLLRRARLSLAAISLFAGAAALLSAAAATQWLPISPALGLLLLLPIPAAILFARKSTRRAGEILAPYGSTAADITRRAEAYTNIYNVWAARRAAEEDARERAAAIADQLRAAEEELLRRAKGLDATVCDLAAANAAIETAIACHRRLETARQTQAQLYERCEVLAAVVADSSSCSAEVLRQDLQRNRQELTLCRRRLAALQNELHQTGAEEDLIRRLEENEQELAALGQEYEALSLAIDTLDAAHAALQNRFSPELGKKSAKYFAKLTKEKYNNVLLSRELEASVQEAGSPSLRPFRQLSLGATQQLYLAVRLAICDLVLPEDKSVPLVLDDALIAFDDERMAAALDVLMEIAQRRQILFFTCQQREQDYLRRAWPERYTCLTLSSHESK